MRIYAETAEPENVHPKDIWVLIEQNRDGTARSVSIQLLTPGRRIADQCGGTLTAVILGGDTGKCAEEVSLYGVDRIITADNVRLKAMEAEAFAEAVDQLARKYRPEAILIGATVSGREIAPRIACRLKTGLTADCTDIAFDAELRKIIWTRPAYGGNLMAEIYCPRSLPQMGTVRSGIFAKPQTVMRPHAEIITETLSLCPCGSGKTLVQTILDSIGDGEKIENAEIVISAGRGVGEGEIKQIKKLSDILGGAVAASRGAVEEGWFLPSQQVGQTGKTISPKLYIACGISGAIQHLVGMTGAKTVVAINTDKDAPIFSVCDYGIVGDVREVIPALIKELEDNK